MAVTISDSCGAILDHASFKVLMSVLDHGHPKTNIHCKMKKDYFDVYTPFYMDTQAQRIVRESQTDANDLDPQKPVKETSAQRKRRKKKIPNLTDEEQKVSDWLERALSILCKKAKEKKLFLEMNDDLLCQHDNNKSSRLSVLNLGCGDIFQELCLLSEENPEIDENKRIVIDEEFLTKNHHFSHFVNKFVENLSDVGVYLNVEDQKFVVPSASRFLMSTYSLLVSDLYGCLEGQYDLIVMDPPWYNKSVKRKKSYNTFDESELNLLPVSFLSKPRGLICVWVTNNERIVSYVKDVIFPAWNVDWIADWFWLKVTLCGEPVCDIRSSHKKPYERLVIGRHKDRNDQSVSNVNDEPSPISAPEKVNIEEKHQYEQELTGKCDKGNGSGKDLDKAECDEIGNDTEPPFPKDFVLVSVPCALHSKKPPLSEVLTPYLPANPKCLEMFARNILPGWTSWGNEVLRHQHIDCFDVIS